FYGKLLFIPVFDGPIEHGSSAELGATRGSTTRAAPVCARRIDCLVQRTQPAVERFIADRRDDKQIAGASRGDVGDSDSFGSLAGCLLGLVVGQFARGAAQQASRAQAAGAVDELIRLARGEIRGQ